MVINSNKEANEILDTESKLSEPVAGVEKGLSIWQLAFPSILGNLSYTLVGMVQVKFVGELGTEALAAMGAGSRVFFALQAIMMAISAGTTALVARAWGAGDYEEASRVTMASMVLAGLLSLLIAVFGIVLASDMAGVFGLDEATSDLATRTIQWLSFFNLAFAVAFVLQAALRASGDAWTPLWVGIGCNIINLPLFYAFIFGNWGAPNMGVVGSAVAGGISFAAGSLFMLIMWLRQRFRVRYINHGWWRRERLARLLQIGYPAALEQGVFQIGFFIFLILIGNYYGTEAFAAYNIGVNLLAICWTVGFGFSIAGSTLVGQHLGAGDPEAASRSGWRSTAWAMLSMGSLGLLIVIFAEELAVYFIGDQPITVKHTVEFTYILGAMMPLMAIEMAVGGSLRGAGDTRFPLIATLLGLVGMRCGLASLATYLGLPVFWVYASLIGDYVLKAILLVYRFYHGRWKSIDVSHEARVY